MKRTLAVLLILAGLGAYVYFVEIKGKETKEAAEKEAAKIFDVEKMDVERIAIDNEHGRIVLAKKDGAWTMAEPISAPADESAVSSLLTSIDGAETKEKIENAGSLSSFGLEPPRLTITVTERKNKTATARIGKRSPVSQNLYVLRGDDPAVYTSASGIDGPANKKPEEFRDKRLFTQLNAEEVTAVTIRDGKTVTALRRNGEDWRITEPVALDADDGLARGVAQDLTNLRAVSFLAENAGEAELAQHGLKNPEAVVEVTLTNGAKHAVAFGKLSGSDRTARAVGKPQIVSVADWSARNVLKSSADLRDRQLVHATQEQIGKLVFRSGKEKPVTLTKTPQGWSVEGAATSGVASAEKVDELLAAVVDLRANEWKPSTKATQAEHQLNPPLRTLEIYGADGKPLTTLNFGKEEDSWAVWAQTNDKSVEAKLASDFVKNKWPSDVNSLFANAVTGAP